MTFFKRLRFYGFGFILGIILLMFFLNEKGAGCDYFPNARILKLIREKHLNFSKSAINSLQVLKIDTLAIKNILMDGTINFSKSKVHIKPCRFYWIEGVANTKKVVLYVKNCKEEAMVEKISLKVKE